jgi:2,4-dienoyl-CoA reductase-like NADH-dependent reductase (Old Yellow Enzyme family)
MERYKRVAQLRTAEDFRTYLDTLGVALPFDETIAAGPDAPLAQPIPYGAGAIGNRFCILPMEGWDGTPDGRPTELTARRWQHFGASGAKLIWGGEAVAVRHDGRANPRQLRISAETWPELAGLREQLVAEHAARYDRTDDLLVGLQLTHSGRFARPDLDNKLKPSILYPHPVLNRKFGFADDYPVMSDDDIRRLVDDFIVAARLARQAGFDFVDLKHCHGYLGHEFLSAVDRGGRYGGSFENRTRFLRELVEGIRAEVPGLDIGVRLSAFDWAPFKPGADGAGEMEAVNGGYRYAFGGDGSGHGVDFGEPFAFLDLLHSLDIRLICITAGSPYYNPHIQRPALFPPSDGYQPPEDPLAGVTRQIAAVAALKAHRPELIFVGSGYSYLQEWLPNVAQHVVRAGMADSIGLGRLVLSYPEVAADILAGQPLARKRICRTFSDCTTAPRNGIVSGCYPLDDFYKQREEAALLQAAKERAR